MFFVMYMLIEACPPMTDARLSDSLGLKRRGVGVAVGAVSASSIVVHLDVLEDGLSHRLLGDEVLVMNSLDLQGMVHPSWAVYSPNRISAVTGQ